MYDGGYRNSEDDVTPEEVLALAEEEYDQMTPEEIAVLTERGPLTPFFMPMILMNKKNMIIMMIVNKILAAMAG